MRTLREASSRAERGGLVKSWKAQAWKPAITLSVSLGLGKRATTDAVRGGCCAMMVRERD